MGRPHFPGAEQTKHAQRLLTGHVFRTDGVAIACGAVKGRLVAACQNGSGQHTTHGACKRQDLLCGRRALQ